MIVVKCRCCSKLTSFRSDYCLKISETLTRCDECLESELGGACPSISGRRERRKEQRYALRLPLSLYVKTCTGLLAAGCYTTVNMSSGGLFFESASPLMTGTQVLVAIMPVDIRPIGAAPPPLQSWGKIVRSDDNGMALRYARQ